MEKLILCLGLMSLILFESPAQARTIHYDLTATRGSVNLSGKKSVNFALRLNDSIPAPTLEFTEGDDAEIVLRNQIPGEDLSVHWHGILLPPEMDGVPYVNTPPIRTGEFFTYRFRIRQSGTYWYHSHTGVQEQKGIYGAIVIHPKKRTIQYDKDVVVVMSDWSDENATDILKNLRKDGEYYLYKKGTMRSWLGAIQAKSLGNFLSNEWTRMGGMDFSDVGYDAFLINGKKDSQLLSAHAGEKIRIRIINASASSYFFVSLGQSPMTVISTDGLDIDPVQAKEILVGMAETYDVLFEVPDEKNYELKITAQDGTGAASGWIGRGERVIAPAKPFPDMYATMDHAGSSGGHGSGSHTSMGAGEKDSHSGHMNENGRHSNTHSSEGDSIDTLTVDQIKSPYKTAFPADGRTHDVQLVLGGDMARYIWLINGKAIHEDRTIVIKEGDIIKFTYVNTTMMHHPFHLHGHFFRVINKHGDYSPLKHTVDVPPHTTRTTEFLANEPGEWMLHCHNLYHLKTGMARVVKYSSFTPSPEIARIQKDDPHLHDHWYYFGTAEAATNHAQAYLRFSQTWNQLEGRIETRNSAGRNFVFNEPWEVEGDLFYRRWLSRFASLVAGGTVFDRKPSAVVGVGYILPLLFRSGLFINQIGKFRVDLDKRFQWAKTVFTDIDFTWRPGQAGEIGEDLEFEISLMYGPSWNWSAGLMFTNRNVGLGVQIQF